MKYFLMLPIVIFGIFFLALLQAVCTAFDDLHFVRLEVSEMHVQLNALRQESKDIQKLDYLRDRLKAYEDRGLKALEKCERQTESPRPVIDEKNERFKL